MTELESLKKNMIDAIEAAKLATSAAYNAAARYAYKAVYSDDDAAYAAAAYKAAAAADDAAAKAAAAAYYSELLKESK